MTSPPLEVRNVHRFFRRGGEEVLALRDVSFHVDEGELVVLLGPSGSGKSTLLSVVACLDRPTAGEVVVDGEVVNHSGADLDASRRSHRVGCLLQSGGLTGHLTVAEHLSAFGSRTAAGADRPDDILELVGLAHRRNALRNQLSGGEAARAGLALALLGHPSVLVADEPTAHVSSREEHALIDTVRSLTGTRVRATLIVSHSAAVAERADRLLHLEAGRVRT